jgi:hypothetical protein
MGSGCQPISPLSARKKDSWDTRPRPSLLSHRCKGRNESVEWSILLRRRAVVRVCEGADFAHH